MLRCIVAAQNFEYKITNILDKPTESLLGYISVLVRIYPPLPIYYDSWSTHIIHNSQVHSQRIGILRSRTTRWASDRSRHISRVKCSMVAIPTSSLQTCVRAVRPLYSLTGSLTILCLFRSCRRCTSHSYSTSNPD